MAHSSTARAWAQGGTVFGATMMIVIGVFQILMGIAAIARDNFFVVAPNYLYNVDTTSWGWIHLGLGVLLVLVGLFLFTGSAIARALGIALVALSAIANFLFITYYPLWSLVIIAADIWIIWSLASTSLRERGGMEPGAATGMAAGTGTMSDADRWPQMNAPGTSERERMDQQARSAARSQSGMPQSGMPPSGTSMPSATDETTQRPRG